MSAVEALERLGGVASRKVLLTRCTRARLEGAVFSGDVVRVGRGRYALATVVAADQVAHATRGVLCLTSAALHHGWEVKLPPSLPQVVFPKHRRVPAHHRPNLELHRADLHPDDIDGLATSKAKTLEMCGRALPEDEALAVFDSALRHGFPPAQLAAVARDAKGPGSAQLRRVAGAARAEPANPFESVLRAIALTVPDLHVEPQKLITGTGLWARPDLVDVDLRIVLEADSFEWHGSRTALERDAERYNTMVVNGWLVLRFTWTLVMFHPEQVRATLQLIVDLAAGRTERDRAVARAA